MKSNNICFMKNGRSFRAFDKSMMENIEKTLPAGVYVLKTDIQGFYFDAIESFSKEPKLYGDVSKRAEKIITTYKNRPNNTGVLLVGEKGSGKTLLAREISALGIGMNIPTIIINSNYTGEAFNKCIQDITQETIIVIDEFEKIYEDDAQQHILSLLDGIYRTKKLFIFTSNNVRRISDLMLNRPGRIFYKLEFEGLDDRFVQEYCEDNLIDKKHTNAVCCIGPVIGGFNFDSLKALVEEMNRYNESPFEALQMLNVNAHGNHVFFDIALILANGEVYSGEEKLKNAIWQSSHPILLPSFFIHHLKNENELTDEDKDEDGDYYSDAYKSVKFEASELKKMTPNEVVFVNEEGHKVIFTKGNYVDGSASKRMRNFDLLDAWEKSIK